MWHEREYLFSGRELRSVIDDMDSRLTERIGAIDPDEFLGRSPDDLVDDFTADFTIEVPVLQGGPDEITMDDPGETKIDVSQDPRRAILDPSQPFYVPGTKYTFHVPF